MPVEQIFEKAEDAPEFLRGHLTETNGKFVFKAELPSEVTGLKSALEAERQQKAELEKLANQFKGIDPAKAKELLANAKKAEEDAAKAKGDWDNWKALETIQNQKNAYEQRNRNPGAFSEHLRNEFSFNMRHAFSGEHEMFRQSDWILDE